MAIAIIAIAVLLYTVKFHTTDITQYSHDLPSHLSYIEYIANHLALPPPTLVGNQNPPLYHLLAGLTGIAAFKAQADPVTAIRYLSLLMIMGFTVMAVLAAGRNLKEKPVIYLTSAMVLFWPIGITLGGKISNDILILFLFSVVFHYGSLWWLDKNPRHLFLSLLFVIPALLSKATGIIIFGAMLFLLFLRLKETLPFLRTKKFIALFAGLALALSFNFLKIAYFRSKGLDVPLLLNEQINSSLEVPNRWQSYVFPHFLDIVNSPFTNSRTDPFREFFWNYFLKSLLYGEWSWQGAPIATVISSILLLIILYVCGSVIYRLVKKDSLKKETPFMVFIIFMLGGLMLARMKVHWGCQADARYIYGIIIPFTLLFGRTIEFYSRQGKEALAFTGMALAGGFICLSLLFSMINIIPD